MTDMTNLPEDDGKTGFNMITQKLHCLIVLNDRIGEAMSKRAGTGFFRAFVVEDRASGEILLNQRFRYMDGDSWYRVRLTEEKQNLSREERIEFLASRVEKVMRLGAQALAGAEPPKETIIRFYPPDPEDSEKTLEWLIAHDLVEVTEVIVTTPDGRVVPVGSDKKR